MSIVLKLWILFFISVIILITDYSLREKFFTVKNSKEQWTSTKAKTIHFILMGLLFIDIAFCFVLRCIYDTNQIHRIIQFFK